MSLDFDRLLVLSTSVSSFLSLPSNVRLDRRDGCDTTSSGPAFRDAAFLLVLELDERAEEDEEEDVPSNPMLAKNC